MVAWFGVWYGGVVWGGVLWFGVWYGVVLQLSFLHLSIAGTQIPSSV